MSSENVEGMETAMEKPGERREGNVQAVLNHSSEEVTLEFVDFGWREIPGDLVVYNFPHYKANDLTTNNPKTPCY